MRYVGEVLEKPLTPEQVKERLDSEGFITGVVKYDLGDAISGDREIFMDEICERLIDSVMIENLSWKVVGFEGDDTLWLKVSGDPTNFLVDKGLMEDPNSFD